MSFAVPFDLAIFLLGTFAAAFVTGLAGFAFGMVAAGIWLFALTPMQTTTLIVAYAAGAGLFYLETATRNNPVTAVTFRHWKCHRNSRRHCHS
jgi:hypothetical protein